VYDHDLSSQSIVESSFGVSVTDRDAYVIVMYVPYRTTAYVPVESNVGSYEGVKRSEGTEESDTLFDGLADEFTQGLPSSQAQSTKLL
jgi:hypothetical protein